MFDSRTSHRLHCCYYLCLGVMYACSTLGPAIGYIVGGQLLTIYVDYGRVDLDK